MNNSLFIKRELFIYIGSLLSASALQNQIDDQCHYEQNSELRARAAK